jgi:hypothetical protein
MRYHELQRFSMELKLLVEKYAAKSLSFDELRGAGVETLERLADGRDIFDDADTENERAADYELSWSERQHKEPPIT